MSIPASRKRSLLRQPKDCAKNKQIPCLCARWPVTCHDSVVLKQSALLDTYEVDAKEEIRSNLSSVILEAYVAMEELVLGPDISYKES